MDILIKFSEEEIQKAKDFIDKEKPYVDEKGNAISLREHFEKLKLNWRRYTRFIVDMEIGEYGYITNWMFEKKLSGEYQISPIATFERERGGTAEVYIKRVRSGFVIQWVDPEQ